MYLDTQGGYITCWYQTVMW